MAIKTTALKSALSLLRLLQLLSSIVVLAIYSYFIAVQRKYGLYRAPWVRAVLAIGAAAVFWTLIALLATVFVGGAAAFGFPALILDLLFFGAFIAVTILTRSGRRSCRGNVSTPIGSGNTRTGTVFTRPQRSYRPNLVRSCRLQKAVFAVAIILFILFLLSAIVQYLLVRHHKNEKRYGPSPSNNYTKGSGARGFFARKPKHDTRDAELATAGATTTAPVASTGALEAEKHHNMRPSHDTAYTGSTVAPSPAYNGVASVHDNRPIPTSNTYTAPTYATTYQQTSTTPYPDTPARY